jgi:hypothetical protein
MYIYIVKSTELLNYIGHGLYNEAEYEHGIYPTNEQAEQRVKELKDEGIEARIESRWIE